MALECCVRRAGLGCGSRDSALLRGWFFRGEANDMHIGAFLASLVAHAPPQDAASLVASLLKAIRRTASCSCLSGPAYLLAMLLLAPWLCQQAPAELPTPEAPPAHSGLLGAVLAGLSWRSGPRGVAAAQAVPPAHVAQLSRLLAALLAASPDAMLRLRLEPNVAVLPTVWIAFFAMRCVPPRASVAPAASHH